LHYYSGSELWTPQGPVTSSNEPEVEPIAPIRSQLPPSVDSNPVDTVKVEFQGELSEERTTVSQADPIQGTGSTEKMGTELYGGCSVGTDPNSHDLVLLFWGCILFFCPPKPYNDLIE